MNNYQRLLYLVRHGEAKSKEEDPQRPLSEQGRQSVERLARWTAAVGMPPNQIVHSGKLRAEQTAEILAGQFQPSPSVDSRSDLGPNDDVRSVADSLAHGKQSTMLVGHLPFLSRLVSYLVVGDADQPLVRFEAAGLATLVDADGRWTIAAFIHPDLFPDNTK